MHARDIGKPYDFLKDTLRSRIKSGLRYPQESFSYVMDILIPGKVEKKSNRGDSMTEIRQ